MHLVGFAVEIIPKSVCRVCGNEVESDHRELPYKLLDIICNKQFGVMGFENSDYCSYSAYSLLPLGWVGLIHARIKNLIRFFSRMHTKELF